VCFLGLIFVIWRTFAPAVRLCPRRPPWAVPRNLDFRDLVLSHCACTTCVQASPWSLDTDALMRYRQSLPRFTLETFFRTTGARRLCEHARFIGHFVAASSPHGPNGLTNQGLSWSIGSCPTPASVFWKYPVAHGGTRSIRTLVQHPNGSFAAAHCVDGVLPAIFGTLLVALRFPPASLSLLSPASLGSVLVGHAQPRQQTRGDPFLNLRASTLVIGNVARSDVRSHPFPALAAIRRILRVRALSRRR